MVALIGTGGMSDLSPSRAADRVRLCQFFDPHCKNCRSNCCDCSRGAGWSGGGARSALNSAIAGFGSMSALNSASAGFGSTSPWLGWGGAVLVDPVVSEGVEPAATDCRGAGFMMTNSSAATATMLATAATRAATLSSAARRSKSRVRLAGSLITLGSGGAGRGIGGDLMGSDLALCETDGPSFAALSRNRRGA
jgi:hypothetical protein